MVGFTTPNRYEPAIGWRATLAEWVRTPSGTAQDWQHQISRYWRWRTVDGMPLKAAWKQLAMPPAIAKDALDPNTEDNGLLPPEVVGRVLARSRADANWDSNVDKEDKVIIAPTPAGELPDKPQVGFDPDKNLYQPREGWRAKITGWLTFPPSGPTGISAGSFPFNLREYWEMKTKKGKLVEEAWAELDMSENNAGTSLNKDHSERGSIPPELIGYVVARARGSTNPKDEAKGIILYPERTV